MYDVVMKSAWINDVYNNETLWQQQNFGRGSAIDLFGKGIRESQQWLLNVLISLLMGFLVWQVLWLLTLATIYVVLPSHKQNEMKNTVKDKICCCLSNADAEFEDRILEQQRYQSFSFESQLLCLAPPFAPPFCPPPPELISKFALQNGVLMKQIKI